MSGFDANFDLVRKALDIASLRHKTIANNLANANTPGYKRLVVEFEKELASAVEGRRPAEARIVEASDPAGIDGNNVRFESELADLQKNAMVFNTFAQIASRRMNALRSAITGNLT